MTQVTVCVCVCSCVAALGAATQQWRRGGTHTGHGPPPPTQVCLSGPSHNLHSCTDNIKQKGKKKEQKKAKRRRLLDGGPQMGEG